MRTLVMGGSLFNGRSLVHELVAAGHDVTVCNRGVTPVELPAGVGHLIADRTDHAAVRSVLGGTEWDAVIDMSAYHPEDVRLMVDVLAGRVGHYLFVSSTVTYAAGTTPPITEQDPDDRGPDQNEYGLHKLLCEDVLLEAFAAERFPATTVPLSMVFGPHNALPDREQRMFSRLMRGRPVLVPGDGSTLGIVGHVDDQSRALIALCGVEESFGRRFNCTGDDPHSDQRYVETFAAAVGVAPEVVSVPAATMDALWDGARTLPRPRHGPGVTMDTRPTEAALERTMPHVHKFQITQLIQRLQPNLHRWDSDVVFSVDALKQATGWTPRHDFDSAVEDTYRWYRDSGLFDEQDFDFAWEDWLIEQCR